ncbi:MAG TPA: DUF3418 domain-containing protein, partial [Nitrososphaera sp.]|nr:DUF3418 domain-containing protein [Nitrososphaera sp.]
ITGKDEKTISTGRDLSQLKQGLEKHETPTEQTAWEATTRKWEQYSLSAWVFGDLPEQIEVAQVGGVSLLAFPGLVSDEHGVHLKLFRKREEAEVASQAGFTRLVELALQKELAWVQKDLRALEKQKDSYKDLLSPEEMQSEAFSHLQRCVIQLPCPLLPLRKEAFSNVLENSRAKIPGLVPKFLDVLQTILKLRHEIRTHKAFPVPATLKAQTISSLKDLQLGEPKQAARTGHEFLREQLDGLMGKSFLRDVSFPRLQHFPRYLKALQVRADRALLNPAKDQDKAKLVQPFITALSELRTRKPTTTKAGTCIDEFRWMVEEFKISVFAQELGTTFPISSKRLEAQLQVCREFLA